MVDLIGAAALLGAILLPVNYRLNADEIAFVLADGAPVHRHCRRRTITIPSRHVEGVAAFGAALFRRRDRAAAPFSPFSELAGGRRLARCRRRRRMGFVIIHTAAVGGRPRGALLSQAGMLTAQSSLVEAWRLDERDVSLGVLPLFHVAGLGLMLTVQQAGGASVIAAKFDAAQAARDIAAEKVTVMSEFAPMLGSILDQAQPGMSSLRAVTGLDSPATIERFEARVPMRRFGSHSVNRRRRGWRRSRRIAIVRSPRAGRCSGAASRWSMATTGRSDRSSRRDRGARSDGVQGILEWEADTAVTFRNGWHHTGDMGYFDADGYLWYAGRAPEKELIKTGGENVYPAEVENAIRQHPSIADVVVIGVPDPQWSEAIKAVCVLRPSRGGHRGRDHRVRGRSDRAIQAAEAGGVCRRTAEEPTTATSTGRRQGRTRAGIILATRQIWAFVSSRAWDRMVFCAHEF